jgi:hypothetical protein
LNLASFADRPLTPDDLPFIGDSFARSYLVSGHTAGLRDRFGEFIGRPFRALLSEACGNGVGRETLVAGRVVFPVSEPTEIAGYHVYSPRHSCLVYLLTKPAYSRRGVAAHLLGTLPLVASDNPVDARPYLLHCFSTAPFAKMSKHLEMRTRYSPLLFLRLLQELTEDQNV